MIQRYTKTNLMNPGIELHQAILKGDFRAVVLLLGRGADPNARDPGSGRTAVHFGVEADNVDILCQLRQFGGNLSSLDLTYNTPLNEAAETGKIKALNWLLGNIAEKTVQVKGEALFLAAFNGHVEAVSLLLDCGAPLDFKNELGRSALYQAAEAGQHRTVRLLIEQGADVRVRDDYNKTLLHAAAESGDLQTVSLVLDQGMDVNAVDNGRNTALHCAVDGPEEVANLLLSKGADVEARNCDGQTVLFKAARAGNDALVNLLRQKGASEMQDLLEQLKFY